MLGKASLVMIGVAAAAGALLFETSFEVQELEGQLASVNRKIVNEHDQIQVLNTDWNLLNVPGRLEALSDRHLKLQPINAKQIGDVASIPERPAGTVVAYIDPVYASEASPTPAATPVAQKPAPAGAAKPAVATVPQAVKMVAMAPTTHADHDQDKTAKAAPGRAVALKSETNKPELSKPVAAKPVMTAALQRPAKPAPHEEDEVGVLIAKLGVTR